MEKKKTASGDVCQLSDDFALLYLVQVKCYS